MIPELTRLSAVLNHLEVAGPVGCAGTCDPAWQGAIVDAKLEFLTFAQDVEADVDASVYAAPTFVAAIEPSLAAIEAKDSILSSLLAPLPKTSEHGGFTDHSWNYAITLDLTALRELIAAIGRINNGVIQPGDEPTIMSMPGWTWLLDPVYGPWVTVVALTPLVAMHYMLMLSTYTGGPAGPELLLRAYPKSPAARNVM